MKSNLRNRMSDNKYIISGLVVLILIVISLIGVYKTGMIYRYFFFIVAFAMCIAGFIAGHESEKEFDQYDKKVQMVRQWTPRIDEEYRRLKSETDWSMVIGVIGAIIMIIAGYYLIQNVWGIFSVISTVVAIVFLAFCLK